MHHSLKIAAVAVAMTAVCSLPTAVQATTLNTVLNVDNSFQAFISTDDSIAGTLFSSGAAWATSVMGATSLTNGVTNYLHIQAQDNGDPAMLLGLFTLSDANFAFQNGTQRMVSGDSGLVVSDTGWTGYGATRDLGPRGTSPWGNLGTATDTRFVWAQDLTANTVYFSTAIKYLGPDISVVPLPAGLPLFLSGLGILGITGLRRRAKS